MKTKIYLRVAKNKRNGVTVSASSKPNYNPLESPSGYKKTSNLPTLAFAISVDIPDESFKRAEKIVADLILKEGELGINQIKTEQL